MVREMTWSDETVAIRMRVSRGCASEATQGKVGVVKGRLHAAKDMPCADGTLKAAAAAAAAAGGGGRTKQQQQQQQRHDQSRPTDRE